MNDYFKTPKGTILPFLDLRGKKYLQVMHRLVWLREEHPNWSIITEPVNLNDTYCIFKATLLDENNRVLATAHGREDFKHFQDAIEKSETKSIGRVLALCGYGTQFAPELDEEDRIVDSPVPKIDSSINANKEHSVAFDESKYKIPFGKFKGLSLSDIPQDQLIDYIGFIEKKSNEENKPISGQVLEFVKNANQFLDSLMDQTHK